MFVMLLTVKPRLLPHPTCSSAIPMKMPATTVRLSWSHFSNWGTQPLMWMKFRCSESCWRTQKEHNTASISNEKKVLSCDLLLRDLPHFPVIFNGSTWLCLWTNVTPTQTLLPSFSHSESTSFFSSHSTCRKPMQPFPYITLLRNKANDGGGGVSFSSALLGHE